LTAGCERRGVRRTDEARHAGERIRVAAIAAGTESSVAADAAFGIGIRRDRTNAVRLRRRVAGIARAANIVAERRAAMPPVANALAGPPAK
jgi:hypothetical protein